MAHPRWRAGAIVKNVVTIVKIVSLVATWEDGDPTVYTTSKKNEKFLDEMTIRLVRSNMSCFPPDQRATFRSLIHLQDGEALRDEWNEYHIQSGEACRMEIVDSEYVKKVTPLKPFVVRTPSGKLLKHFDTVEELRVYLDQHPGLKELYNR